MKNEGTNPLRLQYVEETEIDLVEYSKAMICTYKVEQLSHVHNFIMGI